MKKMICLLLLLTMLPLSALAEPTTLRVAGFISEYDLANFTRENPDIRVEMGKNEDYFYGTNALIQALATKDASYDILVTNTEAINLEALMEKGYAVSLSDSETLCKTLDGMYPFLREALSYEGVYYGLPLNLFTGALSYFPAAFEATGLEIPTTWQELEALINDFPNQPEEIREDYEIIMWMKNYRRAYFMRMVEAYVTHRQATGQELRFDMPLFRELLALAEGITTENDVEEEREAEPLMQNMDILQFGYQGDARLLPLAMEDSTSIGVSAFVAIINPYSDHIPEAMRVLEYLAANYTPGVRLTLLEEGNEPVENADYPQLLAAWEAEKARLEQALAEGDPADEREDQEALEQHMESLRWIANWQHWVLSPQTIVQWQEIAPYLIITKESPLQYQDASGQFPAEALMRRYMDGELPAEQFIRQMDEKCQMMLLERQ